MSRGSAIRRWRAAYGVRAITWRGDRAAGSLARRQIVTLVILSVCNVVLLVAGFSIVRRPSLAVLAPTPISQASCQAMAAQSLAARDLAGTVRLDADGALRFELFDLSRPRASEAAWDALAAAVTLPDVGCGLYPVVRVDVPESSEQPGRRLLVQVSWIDLRAWNQKELDDGELSARLTTTTYVRSEKSRP